MPRQTKLQKTANMFTVVSSAFLVLSLMFPKVFTFNILPLEVTGQAQALATPIYFAWVFGVLVLAGLTMRYGKKMGLPL